MQEYLESIKDRIVISIPRVVGLSPWIERQEFKYVSIAYSHERGFFISTKGMWLDSKSAMDYAKELDETALIARNLNHY